MGPRAECRAEGPQRAALEQRAKLVRRELRSTQDAAQGAGFDHAVAVHRHDHAARQIVLVPQQHVTTSLAELDESRSGDGAAQPLPRHLR